jgi:hypothetical protein
MNDAVIKPVVQLKIGLRHRPSLVFLPLHEDILEKHIVVLLDELGQLGENTLEQRIFDELVHALVLLVRVKNLNELVDGRNNRNRDVDQLLVLDLVVVALDIDRVVDVVPRGSVQQVVGHVEQSFEKALVLIFVLVLEAF